ncbi:hypothetical protein CDD83_5529 [Cordyceps sp. RAO-2017]|nr:hypothetical protein CDD83_5529 [Cordyceps sp. RAO-2017]
MRGPGSLFREVSHATRVISCNGGWLLINENLYDFLLQLRQWPDRVSRQLWVDAICINQDDLAEKSAQVRLMGQIYRSAECVVVWLGECETQHASQKSLRAALELSRARPERERTTVSFRRRDYVLNMPTADETYGMMFPDEYDSPTFYLRRLRGVTDVFFREYFRRTWVIQEMVLARQLRFYVGPIEISLPELQHSVDLWAAIATNPGAGNFTNLLSYTRKTGTLSLPFVLQAREQLLKVNPESWSLEDYLMLCRDHEAKNPVDKVFALLGVADEASLVCTDDGRSNEIRLNADYSKCVAHVYLDCMKTLLCHTSLSNVLSLVGKDEEGVKGIPSWIPDFSVPLRPKPFSSFGPIHFQTATSEPASFDILADTCCLPFSEMRLHLAASPFDSIAKIGESSVNLTLMNSIDLRGAALDLVADCGMIYAPTGEPTLAAFLRTMTADLLSDPAFVIKIEDLQAQFLHWIDMTFHLKIRFQKSWRWRTLMRLARLPATKVIPTMTDPTFEHHSLTLETACRRIDEMLSLKRSSRTFDDGGAVAQAIKSVFRDRRIFRTERGYLGIGPRKLREGDQVMLVAGAELPFIFRQNADRKTVSFVGAAYVHGIMNGEAVEGRGFETVSVV